MKDFNDWGLMKDEEEEEEQEEVVVSYVFLSYNIESLRCRGISDNILDLRYN